MGHRSIDIPAPWLGLRGSHKKIECNADGVGSKFCRACVPLPVEGAFRPYFGWWSARLARSFVVTVCFTKCTPSVSPLIQAILHRRCVIVFGILPGSPARGPYPPLPGARQPSP